MVTRVRPILQSRRGELARWRVPHDSRRWGFNCEKRIIPIRRTIYSCSPRYDCRKRKLPELLDISAVAAMMSIGELSFAELTHLTDLALINELLTGFQRQFPGPC